MTTKRQLDKVFQGNYKNKGFARDEKTTREIGN